MVRKTYDEIKENMAGGKGKALVRNILKDEDLGGAGRLYAKITLEPGASVGWHQHIGETEPYYILEGNGTFIDNDKSRNPVGPGNVCTIEPGQYHSLENTSDEPLTFLALIYNTDL